MTALSFEKTPAICSAYSEKTAKHFVLENTGCVVQSRVSTPNTRRTRTMQAQTNASVVMLENQLTERFGLLLSQTQLAELLGQRVYYPAAEVSRIIIGTVEV